MMPVQELKSRLNIKTLPQEDDAIYNTLAGLLLAVSGRLPKVGEATYAEGWRFEVVDLDGRRIDKAFGGYLVLQFQQVALSGQCHGRAGSNV
jgi:putative hemolysin